MEHGSNLSTAIKAQETALPRRQGFLCYCRKDLRHASRLRVHLASCQQISGLTIWDDSQIQAGSLWKNEVASALAMADFAILLISADFLASSLINTFELPRLLSAAQSGGTHILPVIVGHCAFEESAFAAYQAINNPARPLSRLAVPVRDEIWVSVIRTLIHTVRAIEPSR